MTSRSNSDRVELGLADTSLFVALEHGRPLAGSPPDQLAVSTITVGELRFGVLAAADGTTRARRLATLSRVERLEPLPIDDTVAQAWAALRLALREAGKRMRVNDSWIAATANAHEIPVVTQDGDYEDVPGVAVIRL
jgi:hypothetical protein